MSNPIVDTVEYFKRRQQNNDPQHRHSAESGFSGNKNQLFTHNDGMRSTSLDIESSSSKQQPSTTWNRVLAKLGQQHTDDTTEHSTSTRVNTNEVTENNTLYSNPFNDEQEENHNIMGIDRNDTGYPNNNNNNNRDSTEPTTTTKEQRWLDKFKLRASIIAGLSGGQQPMDYDHYDHYQHYGERINNHKSNDDDDQLPSTCDFTHDILNDDVDNDSNYFAHPFLSSNIELDQDFNNHATIPTTVSYHAPIPQLTSPAALTPSSSSTTTSIINKRYDSLPKHARFHAIPNDQQYDNNNNNNNNDIPTSSSSPSPPPKLIINNDDQQQDDYGDEEEEEKNQTVNKVYLNPSLNDESGLSPTNKTSWDKTKDKIKLITTLQNQSSPNQLDTPTTSVTTNTSLAPYYPSAFDPLFIAFSKDEHGNKLPPILLPCIKVAVTDSKFLEGLNQWAFRIELQYGDVKWVIYRSIADFVILHYVLKFKSSLSSFVPAPPAFPNQLQSLYDSAITSIGWDRKNMIPTLVAKNKKLMQQHLDQHNKSTASIKSNSPTTTLNEDPNNNNSDNELQDEIEKQKEALERRRLLTVYLRELFERAHIHISYDICEFLELSAISIVQDMGWKGKEGYLQNRINFVNYGCCQMWTSQKWNTQWVLLRDSYVAFCENISSSSPTDVLLLDKGFTVQASEPNLLGNYKLTLTNQTRRIRLKGSKREMDEWLVNIKKVQNNSPWVRNHRFGSYAPVRHNAKVKWFIDGENHFNAVAEAILSAKMEIYIADWWLTPEIYLRRPPKENEEFRLDRLLQRKAREGVKIYIIIYKEMSLALTINSAHTKQWLQGLHPNIMVQRHPDHASVGNNVLFWSHHEKMVIVDNRLAFIGGLDLCFGRYDSHGHPLCDYYPENQNKEIFAGQDYSNPRKKDFMNVAQHDLTLVDRSIIPRMPWHDVTLSTVGPMARDLSRHFIQRWNFLKATKSGHRHNLPFLLPKGEYVTARDESKFKGTCRVQALRSSAQWSSGIEREHSIYNAYVECIRQAKHFIYIENQFFISATDDDKLLRNKIGQALVERIIRAKEEGQKFKIVIIMPLVPAFEGDLASSESGSARSVMHFQYTSICRGGNSIWERLERAGIEPSDYIDWYSLRNWGKLAKSPKKTTTNNNDKQSASRRSKQNETIRDSDSSISSDSDISTNYNNNNENENDEDQQNEFQLEHDQDIENDEKDQYVSELLYIHDKIMIVDDKIVIIGSANINDRSQLGNRDSEIAMIIEDTDMIDSFMDGKKYKAAKFAHTLRLQLWKEHLGLLDFDDWESLLKEEEVNIEQEIDDLGISMNNNNNNNNENEDDEDDEESEHKEENEEEERRRHHHHLLSHLRLSRKQQHRHSDQHYRLQSNNVEDIKACEQDEPVHMIDRLSRTKSLFETVKKLNNSNNERLDAKALDPLTDACYYNLWRKTAENNTLTYRSLFRCVPDDTVHTFEQHRAFIPSEKITTYGHVANPLLSENEIKQELDKIQGHLVQFPKDYLKNENMIGGNIIESVTPMVIFT